MTDKKNHFIVGLILGLQSKIESLLQKDKLEHYFVMSLLLFPITMIFNIWWITLLSSFIIGSIKESVDVIWRSKEWSYGDLLWGVMAGIVQALIII